MLSLLCSSTFAQQAAIVFWDKEVTKLLAAGHWLLFSVRLIKAHLSLLVNPPENGFIFSFCVLQHYSYKLLAKVNDGQQI